MGAQEGPRGSVSPNWRVYTSRGGEKKEEKKKTVWKGDKFECVAYIIFLKLLFSFSASATAVAPGSLILLLARLHGF